MVKVIIYTDGACSGNPGPGGYGAVLLCGDKKKIVSGGEGNTTNNRMELKAVIESLKCLKQPCEVDLYSDSAYVINAFVNDWISGWQQNGWRTKAKSAVANEEMWKELLSLLKVHKVVWHKVKGHSDNVFNNECDSIARSEIDKIKSAN